MERFVQGILGGTGYDPRIVRHESQEKAIESARLCETDIWILIGDESLLRTGRSIREFSRSAILIFVIEGVKHVLEAFASMPIAYLPRQSSQRVTAAAIMRAVRWLEGERHYLFCASRQMDCFVPCEELAYLESDYRLVHVHKRSGEILTMRAKLNDVAGQLSPVLFCRCHQKYLVHMDWIQAVNRTNASIVLKSGEALPISKERRPHALRQLERKAVRLDVGRL